jgi:hypothetical protein
MRGPWITEGRRQEIENRKQETENRRLGRQAGLKQQYPFAEICRQQSQ